MGFSIPKLTRNLKGSNSQKALALAEMESWYRAGPTHLASKAKVSAGARLCFDAQHSF